MFGGVRNIDVPDPSRGNRCATRKTSSIRAPDNARDGMAMVDSAKIVKNLHKVLVDYVKQMNATEPTRKGQPFAVPTDGKTSTIPGVASSCQDTYMHQTLHSI